MDQYCVVLCGLQAGALDDTAAWRPVAAALKLDHAEFERRVVAALPRIVRQGLDQTTAERIAQVLQALQVEARVLPDDPQLAYIERAQASCGPLPYSSLGNFIQPGESYRLHGSTTWQPWSAPVDEESTAPSTDFVDADEAAPSDSTGDEPGSDTPSPAPADVADEVSEPWADELSAGASDAADQSDAIAEEQTTTQAGAEPSHAIPPSLPSPPAAYPASTPESPDDFDASAPDPEVAAPPRDDALIDPVPESTSTDAPNASNPAIVDDSKGAAPRRSRTGRLVVLVLLVALAVWAYRHWMADTRVDVPPPAVRTAQPSIVEPAPSMPPAHSAPSDDSTPPPASPASTEASTLASAATTAAPATVNSTPAPATTTVTPPAAASAPAPATPAH